LCQDVLFFSPLPAKMIRALAPATVNLHEIHWKKAQGLKPEFFCSFTARLKSCPDTKQELGEGSEVAGSAVSL
jgi:hypothetical protein